MYSIPIPVHTGVRGRLNPLTHLVMSLCWSASRLCRQLIRTEGTLMWRQQGKASNWMNQRSENAQTNDLGTNHGTNELKRSSPQENSELPSE